MKTLGLSINKRLENLCWKALEESPKTKPQVNEYVVNKILKNNWTDLVFGLNNLGFRLEALKKKGVSNTANCKDANEGLYAKGTWFIVKNYRSQIVAQINKLQRDIL